MMSFRMSLVVKLAPKNTLLLIMLIYIDFGGNELLNKFQKQFGQGVPHNLGNAQKKGCFFPAMSSLLIARHAIRRKQEGHEYTMAYSFSFSTFLSFFFSDMFSVSSERTDHK